MSGIGGIYRFDGGRIHPEMLSAIEGKLARLGPDGVYCATANFVGMVYRPFHTTAESHLETQPLTDDGLMAVFDGRLDNRTSLASLLDLPANGLPDVSLLLASFKRWGASCFARLVGDFAATVWDPHERRLLLARDAFGVRPLFYHIGTARVLWASSVDAILSVREIPGELNERYIALYLASDTDGSLSPFKSISAVKPGEALIIRDGRAESHRFWEIASRCRRIHYQSDRDYEDHFIDLFSDAVRVRLRADRPVMAQLSGGLDSSSIVCVADRVTAERRERRDPSRGELHTISFVFDEARQSDERDFIKVVEDLRRLKGFHLLEDSDPILASWPDEGFISFPSPVFCFGGRLRQLLASMSAVGARVLLSGWCGDHLLAPSGPVPLELADMFRQGKVPQGVRKALQWSTSNRCSIFNLLWDAAIKPNLPFQLSKQGVAVPAWLDRRFASRTRASQYGLESAGTFPKGLPPSQRARIDAIRRGIGAIASGYVSYHTTLGCVEMRFPFLHAPLVEYVLSVPIDQLMRPGENRAIQRRSLRAILPEAIRLRNSKRGPDEAVLLAFRRNRPLLMSLVTGSRVCARGYVDAKELRAEMIRACHGACVGIQALLRFISLEIWLRNLERWQEGYSR